MNPTIRTRMRHHLAALLCLLAPLAAQQQAKAPKPGTIFRHDIDATIAALRVCIANEPSSSLANDVAGAGKVLTAMARCHRRYHIGDGPVVRPTVEFLRSQQRDDGSFGDATGTAWAISGLDAIGGASQRDATAPAGAWLSQHGGAQDPFVAMVAAIRAEDAAEAGAAARDVCRRWLSRPSAATRGEAVDALVQLVACQVATLPRDTADDNPAATFSAAQQRGVDWLMGRQQGGVFRARNEPSLPFTGFGLMALQSKPRASRTAAEQAAIEAGQRWLLAHQNEDGTWGEELQNYTTCVAVGALSKAVDPAAAAALQKAQRALLAFQHAEGDGYQRSDRDYGAIGYGGQQRGDLSNLHFSLQALRATGLPADHEAFQKALVFLQRTQNLTKTNDFVGVIPDPEHPETLREAVSGDDGGACYYPGNSSAGYVVRPDGKIVARSYGSMTYALLKAYSLAGLPNDDARLRAAVSWLQDHWTLQQNPGADPVLGEGAAYQGLFYYYLLMAQALDQCGIRTLVVGDGEHRAEIAWAPALRQQLEKTQRDDGTWLNGQSGRWMESDEMLCTCYALLALEHCR
ncbi:MAG: hypothetical protein KDC48_00630 [Planctomycetes bacterium]|nr:hypothetical protein [Planctomycetota bacterium]